MFVVVAVLAGLRIYSSGGQGLQQVPLGEVPNGKIAFVGSGSRRECDNDICVVNPDGSGQAVLTNTTAWEYGPDWSPDGEKIAFWSNPSAGTAICVINADGTGRECLADNVISDAHGIAWARK